MTFLPSHLSLDQLFAIFENMDHAVYVSDPNTYEVLYANRAVIKRNGRVEGKKCFAAIRGLDHPCECCSNDKIFGTNIGKMHIWEFHDKANNRWYSCYDKAIPWPDGRMVGHHMAIDITGRKEVEEALKRSEAYSRTLAEAAQDVIFTITRENKVDFVNEMGARILRTTPGELKGKSIGELFSPPIASRFIDNIQRTFASGRTLKSEDLVPFPEKQLWLETQLVPLLDETGLPYAVLGISRDITARKDAERALRESEEKFRLLAEQSPNMIFINQKGRIVYANRRCEEITEYSLEELCSPHFDFVSLHAPEFREGVRQRFQRHLRGEEVPVVENVLLTKTGKRIDVLVVTRLIQYRGEGAILGTVIDMTEQKKNAAERERLQQHLVETQKMEAIGALAGGIAHDFNNMITAIRGFAQLVLGDLDPEHPLYGDLKQIETITTRAANLTRQLLLFGRRQPMELRPFNINDTCLNLEKMLKRLLRENITIVTDMAPDVWRVYADENKIEQVIVNLAINARDAMPSGGTLTIKTENRQFDETQAANIPDARPGKFVAVSVTDTGRGINEDDIKHIFEPFFSTKAPSTGTGLGLAVVYGIVRQHQGWIAVNSQPERGTTFTFFLPALTKEIHVSTPPVESQCHHFAKSTNRKNCRILLVEDEELVRQFSQQSLEVAGYDVVSAATVSEAFKEFENLDGEFRLLFSDVVLPDSDGITLAESLRSKKPELIILLASGYMEDTALWPTLKERGYHFLHKPYGRTELLTAIEELLD